jgi:hypothetical protein
MLTFEKKLKIFEKRLLYLVKFFRYFVSKMQFLLKIKIKLSINFITIINQMDDEKKCLLLDQEFPNFDLNFFNADLAVFLEDYKIYKQELLFFFIEYEDFFLRAIDVSVIKELQFFIRDFSYLLDCFVNLNKSEHEIFIEEALIKEFFLNFSKFYNSVKIFFWFVEKAEETNLSADLIKKQGEALGYYLSP